MNAKGQIANYYCRLYITFVHDISKCISAIFGDVSSVYSQHLSVEISYLHHHGVVRSNFTY